jgi:excisionase family DNA binding protein
MVAMARSAVVVEAEESPQLQHAAQALRGHAVASAQLVLDDGQSVPVPGSVARAMGQLVAHLAAGEEMAIGAFDGYTAEEAMRLLGASRSYIAQVLENGELPYRLVDTEVRIAPAALQAHRAKLKELMGEGIRLIQQISEEEGAYDERAGA